VFVGVDINLTTDRLQCAARQGAALEIKPSISNVHNRKLEFKEIMTATDVGFVVPGLTSDIGHVPCDSPYTVICMNVVQHLCVVNGTAGRVGWKLQPRNEDTWKKMEGK
jgi:hypothetical protein